MLEGAHSFEELFIGNFVAFGQDVQMRQLNLCHRGHTSETCGDKLTGLVNKSAISTV